MKLYYKIWSFSPGAWNCCWSASARSWSKADWVPAASISSYLHHALHRTKCTRTYPGKYQLSSANSILVRDNAVKCIKESYVTMVFLLACHHQYRQLEIAISKMYMFVHCSCTKEMISLIENELRVSYFMFLSFFTVFYIINTVWLKIFMLKNINVNMDIYVNLS